MTMVFRRHPNYLWFLLLFFVYQDASAQTSYHIQSPLISRVDFDFVSHRRLAPGSDNWPMTWAEDGHQYTSWGDGGGFGGTNSSGRVSLGVARVEGTADLYAGYNVWGGKNSENPAQFRGKSYGLLSVNDVLYMWVMVERSYFESAELYYSKNRGKSWISVGWRFENLNSAFSVPTFLNFGKAYQGARDDYVYIYAPGTKSGGFASADQVLLARVPRDEVAERKAYSFFAGLDAAGRPLWTSNITQRQAVFRYPAQVHWTVSVAYNPGIARYLLFNNATANPSQSAKSPGNLEIFDAPEPWGPWTKAASFTNWGNFGYTFSYYLAPKWLSKDGRLFTLVFSGTGQNDSWNTVKGTFVTR